MTQNSTWIEDFDKMIEPLIEGKGCIKKGSPTLLRTGDYFSGQDDLSWYPESEYELDPDKVKEFISKLAQSEYERGINDCIEKLDQNGHAEIGELYHIFRSLLK